MYRLLAILSIAFLLLNPAGICAGNSSSSPKAPAHPCCPSAPSNCVCIDRQPAAPVLPALADAGIVVPPTPAAVLSAVEQPAPVAIVSESPAGPSDSRFLQFHQILV
jgi:hypothetical protein